MRFAGVVILYNPQKDVIDNISSYLNELDFLYIFDNTENPNKDIASQIACLPHVKYIPFYENKGISFVLNRALELSNGYDFLLTMDQDSRFYDGMMMRYREIIEKDYSEDNSIAMFASNWHGIEKRKDEVLYVERAITSGSIVNIRIALAIGGFDENLFIDEVDYEFCYRAKAHGYKISCFMEICLQHHLGKPIEGIFFGKNISTWNHGEIRKYYIARNIVYIMQKYPYLRLVYCKTLLKYFLKCFLLEEDKLKRITFMFRGVKDAILGKMGKFNQNN